MASDGVLEEFERRVHNEYKMYVMSKLGWLHRDEWPKEAREKGIVLRWNQKGVSIVDNGKTVKRFRNPYGA